MQKSGPQKPSKNNLYLILSVLEFPGTEIAITEGVAHMEINALISAGDETGRFTVCLDGWSYPELIHKFGGGITVFLEFLGHGIWAFSNPQEDESINRNIGHGELCGWQSWDSGGSQVCGAAVHFSICIQSAIATDWS